MVCKRGLESALETTEIGMAIDESPGELWGSGYLSRCKIFPPLGKRKYGLYEPLGNLSLIGDWEQKGLGGMDESLE